MRRFLIAAALILMAFGGVLGLTPKAPQAQVIPFSFWQNDGDGSFGNALRFRGAASTYLNRTPGSNANGGVWTWSAWVKRNSLGTWQGLFTDGATSYTTGVYFNDSDQIVASVGNQSSTSHLITTNAVFRDPAAWYHVVVSVNTSDATQSERMKIYVNGVRQSVSGSGPTSAFGGGFTTSYPWRLGANSSTVPYYFNGLMADVYYLQSQALTPSSFAQTNANGQWVPKTYAGTYGTNGYHLNFSDASAVTATAIGKDISGNGNNWTPSNFILIVDSQLDGPATGDNYATLNPLMGSPNVTIDTGNLRAVNCTGFDFCKTIATMGVSSGKWYWENEITERGDSNSLLLGVSSNLPLRDTSNQNGIESGSTHVTVYNVNFSDTAIMVDGSVATTGLAATTNGQVISVALDADAGRVYFYRDGSILGNAGGYSVTNASGRYWPVVHTRTQTTGSIVNVNFGQRTFSYTPPTGYLPLKTENLAAPAIVNPSSYFKAATYTGNGSYVSVGGPSKQTSSVNIANSLRFRPAAATRLSRTGASGNRKTWTFSAWVKRAGLGQQQQIFAAGGSAAEYTLIRFTAGDKLEYVRVVGSAIDAQKISLPAFRDTSAWHHIAVTEDAVNATARIYVNGTEVSYATNDNPSNVNGAVNNAVAHDMGWGLSGITGAYLDGYLADIYMVDGTALTASSFGEYDADGDWVPKAYSGSYGTNGFHLNFSDTSGTTATTLGKDAAGSNDWTPNNFSVTAGVTNDALTDTPTAYDATHGNFAVLNVWDKNASLAAPTDGGLKVVPNTAAWRSIRSTLCPSSGKWYWEFLNTTSDGNGMTYGVMPPSGSLADGVHPGLATAFGYALWNYSGVTWYNSASTAYIGSQIPNNAIVGVALDLDAGKIWFSSNGTYPNSGNPATGTNPAYSGLTGTFCPAVGVYQTATQSATANFGQRPFTHTPPSGFMRLNSYNFPDAGFTPDLVITKRRNSTGSWLWYDRARGPSMGLFSEAASAQTDVAGLLNFQSGGFTLGSSAYSNASGGTYVSYMFKEGVTPGFDILTFTKAASSNQSFSHSLGATPKMIIFKNLDSSSDWGVWHAGYASPATNLTRLNQTNAADSYATYWNSTVPTSSQFTMGTAWAAGNHVAYLWAEVPGFSKFGSFVGNGSANGPFIDVGFKPAFVMIKASSATGSWFVFDNAREPTNPMFSYLLPNTTDAEAGSGSLMEFFGNGFRVPYTNASWNASGVTYIYAAFAEQPLKYTTGR